MLLRVSVYVAYAACWVWGFQVLVHDWSDHVELARGPLGAQGQLLLAVRIGLLAGGAASGLWFASRVRLRAACAAEARGLLYGVLFALLITTIVQGALPPDSLRWLSRSIFLACLATAHIVGDWLWVGGAGAPRPSRAQGFDLLCGNIFGALVVLECVLASWAVVRPSPLVFRESVAENIAAMRGASHQPHFDAKLNSAGFADEEFFVARATDLVIAVLADSFGLGVVPLRFNFVTVAEKVLGDLQGGRYERVAFHNFGVPATGLAEYAHLLQTEAWTTRPAIVVVCVFVGNDIHEGISFTKRTKERYRLQEWLSWKVAQRLGSLARLSADEVERVARVGTGVGMGGGTVGEVPAWIEDATLEPPTMTESRFLEIEARRRRVTNPDDRKIAQGYRQFIAGLDYFRREVGSALVIVVIPDEFQVNDSLWQKLGGDDSAHVRDLPQRRIAAYCERFGIECVDLLPVLQSAETRMPTYHLRDTHWNAFGNEQAGRALAQAIDRKLARDGL
jgi:hypothetical protein